MDTGTVLHVPVQSVSVVACTREAGRLVDTDLFTVVSRLRRVTLVNRCRHKCMVNFKIIHVEQCCIVKCVGLTSWDGVAQLERRAVNREDRGSRPFAAVSKLGG